MESSYSFGKFLKCFVVLELQRFYKLKLDQEYANVIINSWAKTCFWVGFLLPITSLSIFLLFLKNWHRTSWDKAQSVYSFCDFFFHFVVTKCFMVWRKHFFTLIIEHNSYTCNTTNLNFCTDLSILIPDIAAKF